MGRSAPRAARFLNVLAEEPRTVAAWLAPRMRGVSGNGKYFRRVSSCRPDSRNAVNPIF